MTSGSGLPGVKYLELPEPKYLCNKKYGNLKYYFGFLYMSCKKIMTIILKNFYIIAISSTTGYNIAWY